MAATDAKRQSRLYINPANVKDTGILTADNNIGLPDFSGSGIIPDSNVQADIEQLKNAGIQQMEANSPACMQDYFQAIQSFALSGMKGPSSYHSNWLYHKGALALGNDNKLYVSIKERNINRPLTNTDYWAPVDDYVEPNFYSFNGTWNTAGDTLTLKPSNSNSPTITTGQNNVPLINGRPIPNGTRFNWYIGPNSGYNIFANSFKLVFQDINGNTTYSNNNMPLKQWTDTFMPPKAIRGNQVVYFYTDRFLVENIHVYAYQSTTTFRNIGKYSGVVFKKYLPNGQIYAVENITTAGEEWYGVNDVVDYTTNQNFISYRSVYGAIVTGGLVAFGNPDPNNPTGLLGSELDPSTHVIRFRSIYVDGTGVDYRARKSFITIEGFVSE